MKNINININLLIKEKNYNDSGVKELVELINSGQWDADTLEKNKIEKSVSTAEVKDIEKVISEI